MKRISIWLAGSLLAAGTLAGCKPDAAVRQGAVLDKGAKPAAAPLDPATLGSVTGEVRFMGKVPAPVKIDMAQDPACGMSGGGDNYSEQYGVHNGGLANVYVYVKGGPGVAMTAPNTRSQPVIMDQIGCQYVPHVVAVMVGGAVEFRNSDVTMHNIHTLPEAAGQKTVDVSQAPKGAAQTVHFDVPEVMMPVRCNNHPWMNAFVNVSSTPFFAVTDADGRFQIDGLPAGEYELGAVHEKLGEQTIHLTVKPHEASKVSYSFSVK